MAAEDFEKDLAGYTYTATLWGEGIRQFALRVLGSAERWVDIATLNNLRYPYLAETASKHVARYGDMLMIPSSQQHTEVDDDPDSVFGVDIRLDNGLLSVKNKDIQTITGVKNFTQAVRHRVQTDTRELLYHPDYGCRVRECIGIPNNYSAGMMAATFVKAAIRSDPRTDSVRSCSAEMSGDTILINARVTPVSGRPAESITWELS